MKQYVLPLISLAAMAVVKADPIEVRVAAYEYPPYFSANDSAHLAGDITAALNAMQTDYHFSVVHIAPNGRYDALSDAGCCDVMLFEDQSWGWRTVDYPVHVTRPIYDDKERFVALKALNRDQSFFEVNGLRFGGIVGYHYPFAAFEKDKRVLEEKFGIYLAHSHEVNLRMLLNGRLDLIMLADAFLQSKLTDDVRQNLLVNEQPYGEHELAVVINPNKALTGEQMEALLTKLRTSGQLKAIFTARGLQ